MSEQWTWRLVDTATGEVVEVGTEPIVLESATSTGAPDAP